MLRIRVIHWKQDECGPKAAAVEALGYQADASKLASSSMREFWENPPAAVVIDLSRLPSHGIEVGALLRKGKQTRLIPLVFVEGEPEKVAKAKAAMPDARFTTYAKLGPVLESVLADPPREALVPKSMLSGLDSGVPLARKLGAKPGLILGLVNAPDGFESLIPGVLTQRNPRGKVPLTMWFVESLAEYKAALPKIAKRAAEGGVWVVWPKRTKDRKPDINGNDVRPLALEYGLVDFKICAVDETWSAMRFAVKKP